MGAPHQLFKMLCMFSALISHEFVYFWFGSRLTEQVPTPALKVVPLYSSVMVELSPEEFAAGLVVGPIDGYASGLSLNIEWYDSNSREREY